MNAHHICIQTDVYAESIDFYTKALNFEVITETPDFHGREYNTWLKLGDFMIELMTNKRDESLSDFSKNNKGIVHFCLCTDNIQDDYKRIKALGYTNFIPKAEGDIYSVFGGKLFKMIAPEGTIIEFRDSWEI